MHRFLFFTALLLGGCTSSKPPAPAPGVLSVSSAPQQTIRGWVQTGKRQTLLLVNPTPSAKPVEVRGLIGTLATRFVSDQTRDMKGQPALAVTAGKAKWTLAPRSIEVVDVR